MQYPSQGTASHTLVLSSDNIVSSIYCGTNLPSAGHPSVEGVFGTNPPLVVCQICFHPGHSAPACPSRYAQTHNNHSGFATFPSGETNESVWYPDSGASNHMTNHDGMFTSKSVYSGPTKVQVANGLQIPIKHVGNITLNSNTRPLHLKDVFHVPNPKYNLMSVHQLCRDNGCTVSFNEFFVSIKDNHTRVRRFFKHRLRTTFIQSPFLHNLRSRVSPFQPLVRCGILVWVIVETKFLAHFNGIRQL